MGKIYQALEKSNSQDTLNLNTGLNTALNTSLGADPEDGQIIPESESVSSVPKAETPITESLREKQGNLDASLVTVHTPQSVESEQFRLLKNNILFPENGYPPKSIMITSPSPDEGKSFVAANLAISIAQSIDEHVLLIDCDLRSPTIHKLFDLSTSEGLSEHLSTARPLSSLLVKAHINKLTILPGGTIPKNPSELLSSEQMRHLIQEVTLRYSDRYIIFDTPPPYITSEGNALSRQVDGIILVIRQGKTRKKDIQNIIDIYGREKIIGVVQNFSKKGPGYGYGYYKYGYGYGK